MVGIKCILWHDVKQYLLGESVMPTVVTKPGYNSITDFARVTDFVVYSVRRGFSLGMSIDDLLMKPSILFALAHTMDTC